MMKPTISLGDKIRNEQAAYNEYRYSENHRSEILTH